MSKNDAMQEVNRRDFLKGGSFATLMTLLGGVELTAQNPTEESGEEKKKPNFKVKLAIIGMGKWGRTLASNLTRMPEAEVVAVCDTYPAYLRRAGRAVPNAEKVVDYKQILANKEIEAVIIATPTHQHRDIVLESLAAGKHVYCEAPIAVTVEDCRIIAQAANKASRSYFQAGLQMRSDPQRTFLEPFIRSGAMGTQVSAQSHWHAKESWRYASPNPDREKEINWRLRNATSPGLIGEVGIHQVDMMTWLLNQRPQAVNGFGSQILWKDGREVDDTIKAVFEFPEGVLGTYDATLANSFDSDYELYYGTMGTVLVRGTKAWMFKEADSPMLGWEVYARKDTFYKETGIALIANATKLTTITKSSLDEEAFEDSPIYNSLSTFLYNTFLVGSGVRDFLDTFGDDEDSLREYIAGLKGDMLPYANYQDGFNASVLAIKANEAIRKRQRLVLQEKLFEI